jgi:hypothetical protein
VGELILVSACARSSGTGSARPGAIGTRKDKVNEAAYQHNWGVFTCTRAPEQRVNFDTGQPRVDKATGLPLWLVQVMALDQSGGDVISVTVAGEPKVSTGRAVTVTNLVALPWSQDGRSGIAYRADAITEGADMSSVKNPATAARP